MRSIFTIERDDRHRVKREGVTPDFCHLYSAELEHKNVLRFRSGGPTSQRRIGVTPRELFIQRHSKKPPNPLGDGLYAILAISRKLNRARFLADESEYFERCVPPTSRTAQFI